MIDWVHLLEHSIEETLEVVLIIFALMIVIELLVLKFKKQLISLSGRGNFWAYGVAALVGMVPGCMGMFAMDSLYMAGYLSFGGIVASMIASIGDEGLVLVSMALDGKFPIKWVGILFTSLVVIGVVGGYLADRVGSFWKLKLQPKCDIEVHEHDDSFSLSHFFKHHLWEHIVRKHILTLSIWVFVTVVVLEYIHMYSGDLDLTFFSGYYGLLMAALIGVLPISGPNIIVFTLFAQGAIPFSILLTNSIVQDGHGLLPIIGFSLKDAIAIKLFNLLFGILLGSILFGFGI